MNEPKLFLDSIISSWMNEPNSSMAKTLTRNHTQTYGKIFEFPFNTILLLVA